MNEIRKLMESLEKIEENYYGGGHYNAPDVRKATNKLHELMDEGTLDPRAVADAALKYMSEDDVADMARTNELIYDDDMEESVETIDELLEGEDEEEEDTSHLSSREFRDLEEDELTHGTYAITDTSDLTPDEVNVGDRYVRNDNPHYKITRKSRNHFTVTNLGSGKSFGVAYKGNEHLAKPDYFKRNTKYL